jgi:hypothetical protein
MPASESLLAAVRGDKLRRMIRLDAELLMPWPLLPLLLQALHWDTRSRRVCIQDASSNHNIVSMA